MDDRFFQGLQGQYEYSLHFRVDKEGENGYIVRSHGNYMMSRSVSTDLELEAGTYSILMKITAKRYTGLPTPEETVRNNCKARQEKLVQIGLAYDLAHARGQVKETDEEKAKREAHEEKAKAPSIKKKREEARKEKYKEWVFRKKQVERRKREKQRHEEHKRKKAEAAKAAANLDDAAGKDRKVPAGETVAAAKDAEPAMQATAEPAAAEPAADKPATDEQPGGDANGEPPAPGAAPTAEPEVPAAEADPATDPDPAAKPDADAPTTTEADHLKEVTTQARIDQFNKDLQAVQASNPVPPPAAAADIDISDTDSVLSFVSSIISDLDFDPDDPDTGAASGGAAAGVDDEDEIDAENEEFANDPWNAVCVVGLRVFSKDKRVSIAVVRPKVGEDEEETPLDLDDPSKGMTEEVGGMEGDGEGGTGDGAEGTGGKGVGDAAAVGDGPAVNGTTEGEPKAKE